MRRSTAPPSPPYHRMDEDLSIDACFDYFRRKDSRVDVLWVKEQIYRTSCVPEACPQTRSLVEIFGERSDSDDDGPLEEGEFAELSPSRDN